jgi:hypothetical protein
LGQVPEIPIIIRSLAGSIALVSEDDLPFNGDPDFFATIDTGGNPKCEIVANYELRWWTGRKPKNLDTLKILNASTLKMCIDHYRLQRAPAESSSSPGPGILPRPGDITAPGSHHITAPGSHHHGSNAGTGSKIPSCASCEKYRQLLSDVLQDIVKFQSYSSVMSTSSENLLNIGVRKASIYNQLHEAAILKETAGDSNPVPVSHTHHISAPGNSALEHNLHISGIPSNAQSEQDRLNLLPTSSYKWTWGETLTHNEVVALRRTGTRPGRNPHTGYDVSLKDGKESGEYSDVESIFNPSSIVHREDPPAESAPPPTDLHFPKYFSTTDKSYDLLRITSGSLNERQSPPLPTALDLAVNWSSSSGPGSSLFHPRSNTGSISGNIPTALDLANSWSAGSGTGSSFSHPRSNAGSITGTLPTALDLADTWSAGSLPKSSVSQTRSTAGSITGTLPTALDLADNWSTGSKSRHESPAGSPAGSEYSLTGPNVLQLADNWKLESDAGSSRSEAGSIARSNAGSDPGAGSDFDVQAHSISQLADIWTSGDDGDESEDDISGKETNKDGEWSYGPSDFDFLNNNMFVYSSEEE